MTQKVISVGDNICLLTTDDKIITYNVTDAGICIVESGNYEIGLWLKEEQQEKEVFYAYFYFIDLIKLGLMWKQGHEESAKTIRNIRNLQK